jgi:putative hydrolase of the HAD superfamily
MASQATYQAVLVDVLGTLVYLEPPVPRLRALLSDQGIEVDEETATAGTGAEIGYYLANHMEGAEHESLERLRDRCAQVMSEAMGVGVSKATMMEALRFSAFPDAAPALRAGRARGLRVVAASNWDCSLPEWLERAGLLQLLDGAASSAVAGAGKPDPAVFRQALGLAGVGPEEAVHVGDSIEGDIEGARSAGIEPVFIDRIGHGPVDGVRRITSLEEL